VTPVDFFASLGVAEQIGNVLSWVAVAISAAVGLLFALLGIRKGLAWFMWIIEERRGAAVDAAGRAEFAVWAEIDRAAALYDKHVSTHGELYSVVEGDDDEVDRFHAWLQTYRRFGDDGDNFDGSTISRAALEDWRL